MKTAVKSILILAVALGATAFTNSTVKKINIKDSTINWTGKKVLGTHTGSINMKEGHLKMDGAAVTGGMFVVDMSTITVTDLKAGEGKEKLEGHLKSADFFGTEVHQTATLVFTNVTPMKNGNKVTANLTIKDTTEVITFDLVMTNNTATASLIVDRTKFGVRYGSGSFFDNLGDKTIDDNFELDITMRF